MPEKIVIGMTGPFGSGCSYISKEILQDLGYTYISLSEILRKVSSKEDASRTELQDAGNNIRTQNGNGFLAQEAITAINSSDKDFFVVDSIRNTHEVDALKSAFSNFFLFAVWASKGTRWDRTKSKYAGERSII